jgi:hypothetical protein
MNPRLPILALLLIVGCGDPDLSRVEETPANVSHARSANNTPTEPAAVVPGVSDTVPAPPPPARAAYVALAPVDRPPLSGEAQLATAGTGTAVTVALREGHDGATYSGAIREGSCARIGSSVASLNPVSTDSAGTGASESSISVPMDSLLGHPHVVVFGPGGRPHACGALRPGAGGTAAPSAG